MEESRLKPMKEGYDKNLFNDLYKKTEGLRKALAYQIDARRFGVDYQEILSWFDVKFIYAFNKYCDKMDPDLLKGHVINALKMFKFRIMREAYSKKNLKYQQAIDITEIEQFENIISTNPQTEDEGYNLFLNIALSFMKKHLTDDAYLVLELQIHTPNYILSKLEDLETRKSNSIPNELLADYLGLPNCNKVISYIGDLKREIKQTIELARDHFQQNPITQVA